MPKYKLSNEYVFDQVDTNINTQRILNIIEKLSDFSKDEQKDCINVFQLLQIKKDFRNEIYIDLEDFSELNEFNIEKLYLAISKLLELGFIEELKDDKYEEKKKYEMNKSILNYSNTLKSSEIAYLIVELYDKLLSRQIGKSTLDDLKYFRNQIYSTYVFLDYDN